MSVEDNLFLKCVCVSVKAVTADILRPRQRFETERTYVPENRNITKHGMPMEELNGTKKVPQETTPLNQVSFYLLEKKKTIALAIYHETDDAVCYTDASLEKRNPRTEIVIRGLLRGAVFS